MRIRSRSVLAVLGLVCSGCASDGLSPREDYTNNLSGNLNSAVYPPTNSTVGQSSSSRPNEPELAGDIPVASPHTIALPIRVGVAQIGELAPPQSMLDSFRQHKELFNLVEPLSGNLEPAMPGNLNGDEHAGMPTPLLLRLRKTAADMGLNYVLVYGGTVDHSSVATPLELFNLTIVGCFVVPSDQIWANGKAAGSLIDVSTGKIALNVSVDARGSAFLPTAMAAGAKASMTDGVRAELIHRMTQQTIDRLSDGRTPDKAGK